MKKNILYYLAGLVLLCVSCSKEVDLSGINFGGWGGIVINTNQFDSAGLSHFNLPLGRYFIYKDSASGQQDSVKVSISEVGYVSSTATPSSPFHTYSTYNLTLSRITGTGGIWYAGFASCDSQYHAVPVFTDNVFDLTGNNTKLPSFWYPFSSSGNQTYTNIAAMTIEGVTYTNVNCFAATNGLSPSNINYIATVFYWVKGIGIIKKVERIFNSVTSSSLLRYG